jgi:hypothetical protein
MLCTVVAGMQTRVLAFDEDIDSFCSSWEDGDGYDCTDCSGGTSLSNYSADGSCDFSAITDEELMLQTAAAYIQDSWQACDDTCDAGYANFVAGWYENYGSQSDPCYQAWKDPDSWMTWAHVGGTAGPQSEWSCSCQKFFVGECS